MRRRIGLIAVWTLSLVAAGVLAHAQAPAVPVPQASAPTVISGNDLGFRVEKLNGNRPVGTLVVRINGQWVDVEFGVGIKRLTAK